MAEHVIPGRRAGATARRRKVVASLGAVALLALVSAALTYTPLFGARQVVVEGNVVLLDDAVAALAGVGEGTNVVHLDAGTAAERLERDAWVESATVIRDLPGTIVVRIVERTPVVVADGKVLASDGTVLPEAASEGLPEIAIEPVIVGPADVLAGAAAAGALDPAVRAQVETIRVEPDGDLVLELVGGVVVSYGPPGQDAEKAEALRALLRWSVAEGVTLASADVSVPSAPTARPADGVPVRLP